MKKESLNGQNSVSKIASKTVGPIVDLEQHLHPDWWKRIFNSMYLKTDANYPIQQILLILLLILVIALDILKHLMMILRF
mgnify:CR=1 FL=1